MGLTDRIARLYWRTILRLSERHRFSGITVGIFLPPSDERSLLEQKCADALELLRSHSPHHFARVQTCTEGILIFGENSFAGRWLEASRLIHLDAQYIVDSDTTPLGVAAVIVHEATHAWLDARGFTFAAERRQRIEAICFRAMAAFVRHVPDAATLASSYEYCADVVLEQPQDAWSDRSLRRKQVQELRELGAPQWLVRAVAGIATLLHDRE